MRKRYQRKRTCPTCHPNKTGHDLRWRPKEFARLQQWEQEREQWVRGAQEYEVWPYAPRDYGEVIGPPDYSGVWTYGQPPVEAQTLLGARLAALRAKIVATDTALLTWEELDRERDAMR